MTTRLETRGEPGVYCALCVLELEVVSGGARDIQTD